MAKLEPPMKEMTQAAIFTARRRLPALFGRDGLRWGVPVLILAVVFSGSDIGLLVRDTLAEAYLQVSVFVAATLILLYALEQRFAIDLDTRLANAGRAQVPIAALLGMLPGCGGAIVVVTQFVNGRIGFGALVAVLVATMGDAAFLLIAAAPQTAGVVLGISLVAAIVCGWVVDAVHGPGFMRHEAAPSGQPATRRADALASGREAPVWLDRGWMLVWAMGVPFALAIAFQQEPNDWFGTWAGYEPVTWLGFGGAMLAMGMWAARIGGNGPGDVHDSAFKVAALTNPSHDTRDDKPAGGLMAWGRRARTDTNFVTVWVIAAFLVFELGVALTGAEPENWFNIAGPLMPLAGVLVGFIPGCGPQILLTTLYLSGAVPMSALLANAISNDGDALFPAIALTPKAAILATAYSAVPALLVGYTAFALGY